MIRGSSKFGNFAFVVLLTSLVALTSAQSLEGEGTTCWYLRKFGYDCAVHNVTTNDGYKLSMFRVMCPKSSAQNVDTPKKVVFLLHGLICSSSVWTVSPEQSLAMTLCDLGYDVWLGNTRGNQFSQENIYFSKTNPKYWKFSWDTMAEIDMPAMLKYTLDFTEEDNLTFVGHSQGATVFFAFAARNPQLASSMISSAHMLSPVVMMKNTKGILPKLAVPVFGLPDPTSYLTEIELLPNTFFSGLVGRNLCSDSDPTQSICEELLLLLFGESNTLNRTLLPDMLRTLPAGSSFRQLKHYFQEVRSGNFEPYDFGTLVNWKVYGSSRPKAYPLKDITTPIFLYYGDKDNLSDLKDVQKLIENLNPKVIKKLNFFPDFNHIAFLFSKNIKTILHAEIIKNMNSMLN